MQFNILEQGKLLERVNEYLIKGKNFKALKLLKKIVKESPSEFEVWLLLGIANRRIGNLDRAINCFKQATELNPEKEEAWGLYTITLLDQGLFNKAERVIEKASELNPVNKKIQFYQKNLIKIYSKYGPLF